MFDDGVAGDAVGAGHQRNLFLWYRYDSIDVLRIGSDCLFCFCRRVFVEVCHVEKDWEG